VESISSGSDWFRSV